MFNPGGGYVNIYCKRVVHLAHVCLVLLVVQGLVAVAVVVQL